MIYDNVTLINRVFDFSALYREATVFFPTNYSTPLTEVGITFYTRPSYLLAISHQNLAGGEDFRFYINETEITKGVKACLIKQLKKIPLSILKQEYLKGAKVYCDYITTFETYRDQYKGEYDVAQAYISSINIDNTLDTLGSRKVGIAGNLHLINYIYRYINIETLSLNEIIEASGLTIKDVYQNKKDLCLQISQGPSPTLSGFDPNTYIPAGSIELNLFIRNINPLEKPLKDIFNRLTQLQMQLDSQRVNYLNPLSDITNKIDTDLQSASTRIIKELTEITDNIKEIK